MKVPEEQSDTKLHITLFDKHWGITYGYVFITSGDTYMFIGTRGREN